jgi:hypothetical protein
VSLRFILLSHLATGIALALCLCTGCSQPAKTAAELDASDLLALLQDRQKADAHNFIETDLGRFRVTHKQSDAEDPLYVQFHLYGIVPKDREAKFSQQWPKFERRTRDAIISLVQRCEVDQLCDPSLALLKEEVSSAINQVLHQRLVIDVAFSDYSTDLEAGMPWSIPPGAEAKAPKGGGHGGGHGH